MRAGVVLSNARAVLDKARAFNAYVDEIAVCFNGPMALQAFVDEAKDPRGMHRMDHFNTVVQDTMVREDKEESFEVRFEFLRFAGYSWRIEAMCVLDGVAPLHELALKASNQEPVVIHGSYKTYPPTGPHPEYFYNLEIIRQRPIAAYHNSYGRFAYVETGFDWYMKPRINLRDQ